MGPCILVFAWLVQLDASQPSLSLGPVQGVPTGSIQQGLELWNTGLAVVNGPIEPKRHWFPVLVDESQQTRDLNGDSDRGDDVLHLVDPGTRTVLDTGLAARFDHNLSMVRSFGDCCACYVSEREQRVDLDGDGDLADDVLHVFDPRTGSVRNLGFEASASGISGDDDVLLIYFNRLNGPGCAVYDGRSGRLSFGDRAWILSGRRVLLIANNPQIVSVLDVDTDTTTELGLTLAGRLDLPNSLVGTSAVFLAVSEGLQGQDLDGDGDKRDAVLFRYDLRTGAMTNLGVAIGGFPDGKGDPWFLVEVREDDHIDLNGDGDKTDEVLHAVDSRTGRLVNLGGLGFWNVELFGEQAAGTAGEPLVGRDLNGDGDKVDEVPEVLELDRGRLVDLKVAGGSYVFRNTAAGLAFGAPRPDPFDDGAPDPVLFVSEPSTHQTYDLERRVQIDAYYDLYIVPRFTAVDRWFAFLTSERNQGDLNGDGDSEDSIAQFVYSDPRRREPRFIDTREAAYDPRCGGSWAVWTVDEADQGQDLNHDGDQLDHVPHAYHAPSDTYFDLSSFTRAILAGGQLTLLVPEAGRVDLNGDGDTNDAVLQWVMEP